MLYSILSLIHISEPTRLLSISYAVFCLKKSEEPLAKGRRIKLITAKSGDTIAKLAKRSNLSDYAEAQLRLVNDLYPDGEPTPGQIIKIIE